ncbi:MAG: alanine racemase [Candidatus Limnocylindrales bacterium]
MIEQELRAAGLPPLPRLAWAEIDLEALASNVRAIRSLVEPGVAIAAVVKADAYGHGLIEAAAAFVRGGTERLCVATLDEGLALRRAGMTAPVLVLFSIPVDAVARAVAADLELVAADEDAVKALLAAWRAAPDGRSGRDLRLQVEIETGLARAGVEPDRAARLVMEIVNTPGCRVTGLWSHLARSEDAEVSAEQERLLQRAATGLRDASLSVPPLHLAATGGLFAASGGHPAMVRPGLCLYGELPEDFPIDPSARAAADALRPAMTLKARPLRIAHIAAGTPVGYGGRWTAERPSRIATLPLGYGDGWARVYQPGAVALIRGRRVPLVGSVAMDAIIADVTDVPEATSEDEFVLLGAQGTDRITAQELARRRTTITWEVTTGIANRLPRVYHADSGWVSVRTLDEGSRLGAGSADPGAVR